MLFRSAVIPRDRVVVEKGVTREFWIEVTIPDTTAPGDYAGTITVRPEAGEAAEIALEARVLPIRLPEAKESIGLNWHMPSYATWFDDKDFLRDAVFRQLKQQRACGMTTIGTLGGLSRPFDDDDVSAWEEFLDVYGRAGSTRSTSCTSGTGCRSTTRDWRTAPS